MISSVLNLFHWTLKMDARSIFPYILRAVFAVLLLFGISMAMAGTSLFGTNNAGLSFFGYICAMNVAVITVAGVSYFVSAVTEEKDSGTYALLRLAGMSPLSITLGKSTSRLVSSLMLLIIQLPFTFLSITLGGILWTQIIAAYLSLAAWMIFVANLSLFCSVRCATSGRAASLAAFLLMLFFFLPPVISRGLAAAPISTSLPWLSAFAEGLQDWLLTASVAERLYELFSMNKPLVFFPPQFWWNMFSGVALFVVSTACLDRWSEGSEAGIVAENQTFRRFKVGRCWRLPIAWKEFLYFTGGRGFLFAKFLMGGLVYLGFVEFQAIGSVNAGGAGNQTSWWIPMISRGQQLTLDGDHGWNAMLVFVCWLSAEVMLYASGVLFFEIRQLTQSTLGTVPISSTRILLEKMLGCAIATLPAVFWVGFTMVFGWTSISRYISLTMVISYLVMLGFSSHVAALLSLYTRWAALPLTVMIAFPAFGVLAFPILALSNLSASMAASQGIPVSELLVIMINVFWTWMFILLPLQIWIRERWVALTQTS
ncbi:MAG: hypothetical protein ACK58L_10235 [Planctomycetota bacterium]